MGDHLDPQAEDHPGGWPGGGPPRWGPVQEATRQGTPSRTARWGLPDEPLGAGIPEGIWRWIVHLKRRIWDLEREAQINKIEIGKNAAVAAEAKEELDIAKFEARKLSGVVSRLQRRLDRLEDLRSEGSNRPPPLESGSDDSWGPGCDSGRSRRRSETPRSNHALSTRGSARRSDPMPPTGSGKREGDKWLSAPYRRRHDALRTPIQPQRPRQAPEAAPPAYGHYGPLRDEVPEEETE